MVDPLLSFGFSERYAVSVFFATTRTCAATIEAGEPGWADAAMTSLAEAGFVTDYVSLVDAETLGAPRPGQRRRLLAAARVGTTRLIDNLDVAP